MVRNKGMMTFIQHTVECTRIKQNDTMLRARLNHTIVHHGDTGCAFERYNREKIRVIFKNAESLAN